MFATTAGAGHFGPLIPVAQACVARGWAVAVAASSGFADAVRSAGLDHLPFGAPSEDQLGAVFGRLGALAPELSDRTVLVEIFGRLDAQAALPGLMTIMTAWSPDLVLRDPAELGSLAAAAWAGIAQAQVAIGMARTSAASINLLEEPLAELESAAALPAGCLAELLSEMATLTSVPPSMDASDVGLLTRRYGLPVAADASPALRYRTVAGQSVRLPPDWGDRAAPLVYVTFGSVLASFSQFRSLYGDVIAALADQPVRVLMTTGAHFDVESLGRVPANTRVERWWPQAEVMPGAAAVIGHGGFGTTMAALVAGVPQVVLPLFAGDQHLHAAQVAATGVGLKLTGADAVAGVAAALDQVLTGRSFAERAAQVAQEMAELPDLASGLSLLSRGGAGGSRTAG